MIRRAVIGISIFVVCGIAGGATGLWSALLIVGLLGLICGPPKLRQGQGNDLAQYEAQERLYEQIGHAKKGRAADPTRPGWTDEHPLLLTNEFRRIK